WENTVLEDVTDLVNGYTMPPLSEMFTYIDWGSVFGNGKPASAFHGDLHPSNILVTEDGFKLIDWREEFGDQSEWGDVYYDLGKILHGLIVSHDLVDNQQFGVSIDRETGHIAFDIQRHHRFVVAEDEFRKWCFVHDYEWGIVQLMCALV